MKVEAAGYFARMSVLGTITNWWEEINDLASHMKISDEDDPSWYAVETDAKKLATYASAVYSDGGVVYFLDKKHFGAENCRKCILEPTNAFSQYHPVSSSIVQYHPVPSSAIQYHPVASSIIQYPSIVQYHPVSPSIIQYHPVASSSIQ